VIAGDSQKWDDFLDNGGIGMIIELTLAAWSKLGIVPDPDEKEERISLYLHRAMKRLKHPNHPFRIDYESSEPQEGSEEVLWKDISFSFGNNEDIYFCWEAKRLQFINYKGNMDANADEYVFKGMQRFIEGKYSRAVHHAGMLGYVLNGNISQSMKNVLNNIKKHAGSLGMASPGDWAASHYRPLDPSMKETKHERQHTPTLFELQHLFLTAVAPQPGKKPGPTPKGFQFPQPKQQTDNT
jgi:hypothetical protein